MPFLEGFVLGLFGSLHCIGMCGPIAIALPGSINKNLKFFGGRLIYNLGRVITYSFFGLIFGLLGKSISLISIGLQQGITIIIGILIIISVFIPSGIKKNLVDSSLIGKFSARIKSLFGKLFGNNSSSSLFFIGILNGFLPCGFVYLGLGYALIKGDIIQSTLFMSFFGLGTLPIMFTAAVAGNFININLRQKVRKLMPLLAVLFGILFILRGLSLGIPYISPKTIKINNSLEINNDINNNPKMDEQNQMKHH